MIETPTEKPFRIFFAVLVCNLIFAGMNVFVKLAAADHSIIQIIFFRNAVGLIPVILVMLCSGGFALLRTRNALGHFMRSFVGNISMIFFFLSFALLPLANAISITSASPLILTVLSIPLLGERVGRHRLSAVAVGLCAVLFMLRPAASPEYLAGSLAALAAAVLGAFAMIIIRKLGRTEHYLAIVFYFSVFGALASGLLLFFGWWDAPSPRMWAYLVMTGILGGCGQIFLTYAFARAPVAYVSSLSYTAIIFGAFFDWIIWHHAIDWHIAAGSAVIIASGVYILHRETLKHRKTGPKAVTLNE